MGKDLSVKKNYGGNSDRDDEAPRHANYWASETEMTFEELKNIFKNLTR